MNANKGFATQTLAITLAVNVILLVATYLLAGNALAFFGLGLLLTLALWFALQQVARRRLSGAAPAAEAEAPPTAEQPTMPPQPSPAPAIQLLSILQRKGRLIDFLEEDLQAFSDAQIGAAVRSIHAGCKEALAEYIALEPIYDEAEGSTVTVSPGFDAHAVRLTGNITGNPPFKGALRHRGWRVKRVELPARMQPGHEDIVAAAEVEVR